MILQFPGNNSTVDADKQIDTGQPADVVEFCHGCENCMHLVYVDDGTCICSERNKINDRPIVPIVQNEKTSDWGYCEGEFYERDIRRAGNGNRR